MKNLIYVLSLMAVTSLATAQEIGIQLYSLRNQIPKDVPGTFAEIKKWGIREIEGGGTYGLSMDDFKKLLVENNLKLISISTVTSPDAIFRSLINDFWYNQNISTSSAAQNIVI